MERKAICKFSTEAEIKKKSKQATTISTSQKRYLFGSILLLSVQLKVDVIEPRSHCCAPMSVSLSLIDGTY